MFDENTDLGGPSTERSVELRPRGSGGQSSRSIRRQTWNRDDVSLLQYSTPVYHHNIVPSYKT